MTPTHERAARTNTHERSARTKDPHPQYTPLPGEMRRMLLLHMPAAIDEMEEAVRTGLPHYTHIVDGTYGYSVRQIIDRTVNCFVSIHDTGRPGPAATAEIIALYERIGARHGRLGCPLDVLRDALDLAGRVACRRLIKDAYRLHWPAPLLATLTEDTFTLIGTAIAAATRGYTEESHRAPLDVQRDRLRDALVAEPDDRARPLAELAAAADWRLPRTLAVLALPPGDHPQTHVLPPEVLADRSPAAPYLILPNPRTPGPRWLPKTRGRPSGPWCRPTGARCLCGGRGAAWTSSSAGLCPPTRRCAASTTWPSSPRSGRATSSKPRRPSSSGRSWNSRPAAANRSSKPCSCICAAATTPSSRRNACTSTNRRSATASARSPSSPTATAPTPNATWRPCSY